MEKKKLEETREWLSSLAAHVKRGQELRWFGEYSASLGGDILLNHIGLEEGRRILKELNISYKEDVIPPSLITGKYNRISFEYDGVVFMIMEES